MNNFSKYDYDFFIENTIKKSEEKSIYSALIKNKNIVDFFNVEESKEEVIIIKLQKKSRREIFFLCSLRHQGIARNLFMWEEGNYVFIVQEKIKGMSLYEHISKFRNIPSNKKIMYAYSLAKILKYIHNFNATGLVHGDISPQNILISEEDEVYLIDFGSSFYDDIVKKEKSYYATKGYFSPRLIDTPMSVDRGVDVYSFAMILKFLEIDKESIEGYELYKRCVEESSSYKFYMQDIMTELLQLLN